MEAAASEEQTASKQSAEAWRPDAPGPLPAAFDVERWRADFPALAQRVNERRLVYLDSAASAQKPRAVITALAEFYEQDYANIHRGGHALGARATTAYELARQRVAAFVGADRSEEIVFVRGATEAINLVASSFGRMSLRAGDEVLVSEMEHHSNLLPWQQICRQVGATLKAIPIDDEGVLLLDALDRLLTTRTRIVAITHVSNVLGTINPIAQIARLAHARGAKILVDGAQAVVHQAVDVRALDCDFYTFSGHKLYGPMGIGVLYGKYELLQRLPPYQTGGGIVDQVRLEGSTFLDAPWRFEAGTPNVAGAVGLAAAIGYVERLGMAAINRYEQDLLAYATAALQTVPGLRLIGTAAAKAGVLSFTLNQVHPHDIGTLLDEQGIAVRVGHHCAQLLMQRLQLPATTRASLGLYNTQADLDALVAGLHKVLALFARPASSAGGSR
ncbi:MAG: cysteine desulfurase [Proteobacteria bacterium]|nr:cysteine desulfurase [Pseudomonadota bacterium]